MMYLAFIDPNLVRLFGYSSRNQSDKNMYVKILQMRMDAKHKKLPQEFLDRLNISNDDIKDGLKLIINSYTGTLRASFNNLCDELQGVSICFTGQCLLLQLGHDLMKIPTVHLSRFNTDAVEVSVEEEYAEEVYKVVHEWEEKTGLEMEDDKIVKLVARDINNYCGIYKVKDGYEVHYKGGVLSRGNHKFIWNNKTHKFKYIFKNDLKSNSLTIVSEALLKYLLFDIPIEETINNCNDIWRYQQISHLGSTYEKCIQESPNGDILLQRNNRIYAGLKPSGTIIKVKPNGRRDSLANCPPNPVVDNDNHLTINDINKHWYIQLAQQWANDFKGIKRLAEYKKIELIEIAEDMGIKFDPKIKKDELIKLIENSKNENNMLQKEAKEDINTNNVYNYQVPNNNLSNNKIKDLTGFVNGKLTVIRFIKTINGKSYWECKCDCGKIFIRRSDAIKSNKINGCLQCSHRFSDRKKNSQGDSVKSGKYYRLYRIWKGMKDRCYLQSSKHFDRYGGRGIKICKEWKSNYVVFKEWALQNGYNDTLSIERKNIDKDYEPSNCCWIPLSMQNKNTSRTWRIKYKNVTYTLGDLSEYLHIPRTTLRRYLLKNDMNVDKCIKNYNERTIRNAKKRY